MLARPRRTQKERTDTTRARLLDATIDCLHDRGYARTTTTAVVRRAGLSRGAQLHHFPTKQELVVTAIDHLLAAREREFRRRFARLPPRGAPAERAAAAIDLLAALMQDRTFYAWLEIAVAARTDAGLRRRFTRVNEAFARTVRQTFAELFPQAAAGPFAESAPVLAFAVLQGLALERIALRDTARLERALDVFRLVAGVAFSGRPP